MNTYIEAICESLNADEPTSVIRLLLRWLQRTKKLKLKSEFTLNFDLNNDGKVFKLNEINFFKIP